MKLITALVWMLAVFVNIACAQSFPSKPLTIVVPYPAGGSADGLARVVAPHLSKALGQAVVVDNLSGASGSIGAQKVLQSPPDGHTLMVASNSETILVPLTMAGARYKADDFRMLVMGLNVPIVLLVRGNLAHNSVRELIEAARAPGAKELTYGSVGIGSMPHLAGEHFQQLTGTRLLHVPYRGAAPLMQAFLSGEVDMSFFPLVGPVAGMANTGKVKILGMAGTQATSPPYPNLTHDPALKDFSYAVWSTFAIAKEVPDDTALRLNKVLNDILQLPEVQNWVKETGSLVPPPATLAESALAYRKEVDKLNALAKDIKLQAN